MFFDWIFENIKRLENSFFISKKKFSSIHLKKKFLWIRKRIVESKKFSLILRNIFVHIKENFFKSNKVALIKKNLYFGDISKICFLYSKKFFFNLNKLFFDWILKNITRFESNLLISKKKFSSIQLKKKFLWIQKRFVNSKKFFLIWRNSFVHIKEHFFKSNKVSFVKKNLFFDHISNTCILGLKEYLFHSNELFFECISNNIIHSENSLLHQRINSLVYAQKMFGYNLVK